jgi:hypothetical protein
VTLQQNNTVTQLYRKTDVPKMGCVALKRPPYTQYVAPNDLCLFGHIKESMGDWKSEHNEQHVNYFL